MHVLMYLQVVVSCPTAAYCGPTPLLTPTYALTAAAAALLLLLWQPLLIRDPEVGTPTPTHTHTHTHTHTWQTHTCTRAR